MRAYVQDRYGPPDVVELRDVAEPAVGADEVLIRVAATGLNAADWHLVRGEPRVVRLGTGIRRPRKPIPGSDVAGIVEAVGDGVHDLTPGDRVMAEVDRGGLAELVSVSQTRVARAPRDRSLVEAAAIPMAGITALQALRDAGRLEHGHRVLVIGASGGVGTFAVQIAVAMGATVTGVCSGGNVELVHSLGAKEVVDYTRDDYTDTAERYDLIVDIAISKPLAACRRLLGEGGRYVVVGGGTGKWLGVGRTVHAAMLSPFTGRSVRPMLAKPNADDLDHLRTLVEQGAISPVIEKVYPFAEAVDALRHVDTGRTRGKVVVSLDDV